MGGFELSIESHCVLTENLFHDLHCLRKLFLLPPASSQSKLNSALAAGIGQTTIQDFGVSISRFRIISSGGAGISGHALPETVIGFTDPKQ